MSNGDTLNASDIATTVAPTAAATRAGRRWTSAGAIASMTTSTAVPEPTCGRSSRSQSKASTVPARPARSTVLPLANRNPLGRGRAELLGEVVAAPYHRQWDAGGLQSQQGRLRLRADAVEAGRVDEHERDAA